ncbi:flavoprotein [Mollicutes bacterium LVI A0039]|nr:flavoprotein [Mollicutes bacterium LVI A0039]
MKIILGVTGSIAAYKAADIINRLKEEHEITVIMTESATEFITPLTLQTLSQNKVFVTTFDADEANVSHIDLALEADLILVAPATANIIAKFKNGIADDLLSTIVVVSGLKKVMIAPAMNTHMYENPITVDNMNYLEARGAQFIEPRTSLLACNEYGKGALATVETIVKCVNNYDTN